MSSEWKPLKIVGRGWRINFDMAIRNDIVRGLVEIITNSFDSYTRLGEPGVVQVYKNKREYKITDWAEGISRDHMEEVYHLYYKKFASDIERGFFGKGAKDALYCMDNSDVHSIKDDLHSLAELRWIDNDKEVDYGLGEPSVRATDYGTPLDILREEFLSPKYDEEPQPSAQALKRGNCTIVQFKVPKRYTNPKYETLLLKLKKHYMLRKINTSERFGIVLIDIKEDYIDYIRYTQPIGKVCIDKKGIPLKGLDFPIKIDIQVLKSEQHLEQTGDYRDGGLLITDDNQSVLDITLFKFEGIEDADKLFGEVRINGFREALEKDNTLLDDRRTGLNKNSDLYKVFSQEIEKMIKPLVDEEMKKRRSEVKDLSRTERRFTQALDELNEIAMDEIQSTFGTGSIQFPRAVPGGLAFYVGKNVVGNINVVRESPRGASAFLLVDTRIINRGADMSAYCESDELTLGLKRNRVPPPEDEEFISSIGVSIKASRFAPDISLATVSAMDMYGNLRKAQISVQTYDLPVPFVANGFSFDPDSVQIVDGKTKKIRLWVDTSQIHLSEIRIDNSNPENIIILRTLDESGGCFISPGEFKIFEETDLFFCEITIEGNGIGQKAAITAEMDCHKTLATVKVRSPRESPEGGAFFNRIKFIEGENPNVKAHYTEEGIFRTIYIHRDNPVIELYLGKKENDPGRQAMLAEAIAECACMTIAKKRFELEKTIYENPQEPLEEQTIERDRIYARHGVRMHKALSDPRVFGSLIREKTEDNSSKKVR